MTYPEEHLARELYDQLVRDYDQGSRDCAISIRGAGVHWQCDTIQEPRSCTVHCFSRPRQYLMFFHQDGEEQAAGRAATATEVLAALESWLTCGSVSQLHAQFEFVDKDRRTLDRFLSEILRCYPQIGERVTHEFRYFGSAIYELWLRTKDRSCRLCFYGHNVQPDCVFHWDECPQFQFRADSYSDLAAVVHAWLYDGAMPSTMRQQFPWLEIGEIADYYERGHPIEGEFVMSWKEMERFYEGIDRPFAKQALVFIADMRKAGFDRTLRAGQSLWSLILSRSRRHGLRRDQPYVTFLFQEGVLEVQSRIDGEENLTLPRIEFTPAVEAVLQKLTIKQID